MDRSRQRGPLVIRVIQLLLSINIMFPELFLTIFCNWMRFYIFYFFRANKMGFEFIT